MGFKLCDIPPKETFPFLHYIFTVLSQNQLMYKVVSLGFWIRLHCVLTSNPSNTFEGTGKLTVKAA